MMAFRIGTALFLLLIASNLSLAKEQWTPPKELIERTVIYLDFPKPLNEDQWKEQQSVSEKLGKKLQAWCREGRWCWTLAPDRDKANLLLTYNRIEIVGPDSRCPFNFRLSDTCDYLTVRLKTPTGETLWEGNKYRQSGARVWFLGNWIGDAMGDLRESLDSR